MSTDAVTPPLRQRMIEDMNARKLCAGTQRGHIRGCKRFAAFLKRSFALANRTSVSAERRHWYRVGLGRWGLSGSWLASLGGAVTEMTVRGRLPRDFA
jgi:hypothetical protein